MHSWRMTVFSSSRMPRRGIVTDTGFPIDISRHFTVHLLRPWMPNSRRANTSCPSSDRFRLRELRESQHFSTFYGPSVEALDTEPGVRQGRWTRRFTAIVLNVSRRRFGGPAGVEPQSPGEPGPRRGGPLIATWLASPSRSNLSAPWLRPANARYQPNAVAQGSATWSGITLLSLPPYSPNLNLIERLWKFV